MSMRQAEEVLRLLAWANVPVNRAWSGVPVVAPASTSLRHGLQVTILSPPRAQHETLGLLWDPESASAAEISAVPAQEQVPSERARAAGPRVFISCAHADSEWSRRIQQRLEQELPASASMLTAESIASGETWDPFIREAISKADVALVLVSRRALASSYLMSTELPALLERAQTGQLLVTWVLVDRARWEQTPLENFQALHDLGTPLASLKKSARERVLHEIARNLAETWRQRADERAQQPARSKRERGPLDIEALAAAPFRSDTSAVNAASIAFLAEFNDRAVLIGGDARAETLCESIRALLAQRGQPRLRVNAFVVPHGGSARNLSRELLELLACERYLFSSDGSKFEHPDRETIARIITYGRATPDSRPTLVFNYRSMHNEIWADPALQARYGYAAIYPPRDGAGIKVQI